MKIVRPNRASNVVFGFGALLVFLGGAAIWHTLIDGNSLDCSLKGVICLFIPDRSDWYIHLISYTLMLPFMLALFVWFSSWRKHWLHLNMLTRNLKTLLITDPKLDKIIRNLGLTHRVSLLDSTDYLCFCACLTFPHIYVSRAVVETLNDTELEALLLHEKYHLQNHDPLRIMLGRLTVSSFVVMPVLKDLFERFLVRKEIAADQFAIRYQGNQRGIAGALRKLLQEQTGSDAAGFGVSGTEALKERLNYLLGRQDPETLPLAHIPLSLIAPLLLTFSIVASLTILHV